MQPQSNKNRKSRKAKFYLLAFSLFLLPSFVAFYFSPAISAPPIADQNPDPRPFQAEKLLQLGIRQHASGQFQAALKSLQDALTLFRSIGDPQGEANCLGRMAETFFSAGDYRNSVGFRRQQLLLLQVLDDLPGQADTLNELANAYVSVGESDLAQEFYQLAAAIKKEIGNPQREAAFLGNVGLGYEVEGEYQQAIEFHSSQLSIARQIKDLSLQVYSLKHLGEAYRQLGEYPQAIEFYQQQLAVARQLGDRVLETNALDLLAASYELLGKYDQAAIFYQQQLANAQKAGDTAGEAYFLRRLGQAYSALGQHEQAIALFQQQLVLAKQSGNAVGEGESLNNLGRAFLKATKFPEAQQSLLDSTKVWESIRAKLGNTDNYVPEQARTYQLMQQVYVAQNQPTTALEMGELGSTMGFLALLGMRLQTETASTNLPVAPKQIAPLTLVQIQQIAKDQKATLVKYSIIADEGIYVWVIKPTGEATFRKIDPKEQNTIYPVSTIEDVVASLPEALGVKGSSSSGATKQTEKPKPPKPLLQLNQLLIKPIADLLPQKDPSARVIFIPPKELLRVPFVALADVYGDYLVQKHTISIVPAIQILALTHEQRKKTAGGKPVIVGNPIMPKVAPAVGQPAQALPPLVSAEQEALELGKLLKTKNIFTGNKATKAAILPQLRKAEIVHFATYGILDDFKRQGVPGAIALAPFSTDNGLLSAGEILDLYAQRKGPHLKSELVVLSAGQVGRNRVTSEGITGLSLSLMSAGVPSLVVPLWTTADVPITAFMTEFYTQLKDKKDKAVALREAMLKLKAQSPNPKDWAVFTLIGEAQ